MTYTWQKWETAMSKTLKEHEEICSIRYAAIESRLTNLETKIDEIHKEIDGFKTYFLKIAVNCAIGIATALCAAVFVIKM